MKLLFALLLIPITVSANQLSISESTRLSDNSVYYMSTDRRVQFNYDLKQNYVFIQARRAGVCPYYCGFNYDMIGVGFGANHKVGFATIFVQAGYYLIKNSVGKTKNNENIYYFMNKRFMSLVHPKHFKSYEVKNDNAYGITVGADIPLTGRAGVKISYQYMRIKENIIGNFSDPPRFPNLWQDPLNRDMSTISAGLYYNF